jgi:metallo-beta-lactamase family protein
MHEDRRTRRARLQQLIERSMRNRGVVLIPAFSIGRTQELLYELEQIIQQTQTGRGGGEVAPGLRWEDLDIIVDSPLASRFTAVYEQLKRFWDDEARQRLAAGRHPLSFEQLTTIESHQEHLETIAYLQRVRRPAVVLAASGMCAGGRIVDYLKAFIGDPTTDLLFVSYQAEGTPGRAIQRYGPQHGYVALDGTRYAIRAGVHVLGGYSAHADQGMLVNFVRRMRHQPAEIRLVHGSPAAKAALKARLEQVCPQARVLIPSPASSALSPPGGAVTPPIMRAPAGYNPTGDTL